MVAPAVFALLVWMLIPLSMTVYFSFKKYPGSMGSFQYVIGCF